MFPQLSANTIYRTNHAIDNASIPSIAMNRMVKNQYRQYGQNNPFDTFRLSRGGHRSRNHDMLTGMMTAYGAAGTPGIYAMMGHFMADSFSNVLLEKGPEFRNLWEALYLSTNKGRKY